MLRTRSVVRLAAGVALACAVAGCGRGGAADDGGAEYTIRVAHELTPESVKGKSIDRFKELVEEKTSDAVKVEVYPNSELYGGGEAVEAVQNGSVEMTMGATGDFVSVAPSLQVMDLPFLVQDYSDLPPLTAPGTPVGDLLRENPDLEENNTKVLTIVGSGIRQISTNTETKTMADLKGQRIRSQQSKIEQSIFKHLDVSPVPMSDFSQVYTALEQGVIDGQSNPYSTILSESVNEVQKYVAETDQGYVSYLFIISNDYWADLPADLQKDVQSAADEMQTYSLKLQEKDNAASRKKIEAAGTEIHTFSNAERTKMKKALLPVYDEFADVIGPDIVATLKKKLEGEIS